MTTSQSQSQTERTIEDLTEKADALRNDLRRAFLAGRQGQWVTDRERALEGVMSRLNLLGVYD